MVTLTLKTLVLDVVWVSWVAVLTWCLATAERDRDLLARLLGTKDPE